MSLIDWVDLSDAELRSRLITRGCPEVIAASLVRCRDLGDVQEEIEAWLEGRYR